MKTMKIEITIDLTNKIEVLAFSQLLEVLSTEKVSTPGLVQEATEQTTKKAEKPKDKPKQEKTTVVPEQEETAKNQSHLPEEKSLKSEKPNPGIDLITLRKMVSEKAATHRDAMKAKLSEMGSQNVSSLPEEHYSEFFNFLKGLK